MNWELGYIFFNLLYAVVYIRVDLKIGRKQVLYHRSLIFK